MPLCSTLDSPLARSAKAHGDHGILLSAKLRSVMFTLFVRTCFLMVIFAFVATYASALRAESIKAYAIIIENNSKQLDFALRFAEKLLASNDTTKSTYFEILLGGEGIELVLTDRQDLLRKSPNKIRIEDLATRLPQLKLYACQSEYDRIQEQRDESQLKLGIRKRLEGIRVIDCDVRLAQLRAEGWFQIDVKNTENF